jgi:rhamnogalacturonyl hydrolase YesR
MQKYKNHSTPNIMERYILPAWLAIRTRRDMSVFQTIVRGKFDMRYRIGSNEEHLKATMDWLCIAQDATPDDGVAAAFDVVANKWYPSYPETTGYIIPTFFNYATRTRDDAYRARAIRMADWLVSLQLECGAFPGPPWIEPRGASFVFDTGQIIHGLVRAYEETGEIYFKNAALHAVDWLIQVQEEDGSWRKFDMGYAHVYNARTAWAMLHIEQVEGSSKYQLAALNNLRWVLNQQAPDGWFDHAAFKPDETPLTHTLAYTIEGLLEAGQILCDSRLIEAARLSADALRDRQLKDGSLWGSYGPGWQPDVSWSCLVGNAQMALVWFKFYEMTNDSRYYQAAITANQYLKQVQSRSSRSPGIRGGVAGSYPIYGDYGHYLYLNWAAKFFADSLMMGELHRV